MYHHRIERGVNVGVKNVFLCPWNKNYGQIIVIYNPVRYTIYVYGKYYNTLQA